MTDPESRFILDRAGGPMIWVPPLKAYLHLLPVTKLQFERFLAEQPGGSFDFKWYDAVLGLDAEKTGRVAPHAVKAGNYWQAFLTGIRPDEARVYAQWCEEDGGDEYAVPTQVEWWTAYEYLKQQDALPDVPRPFQNLALSSRMSELIERLEIVNGKLPKLVPDSRKLAEQMYLRNGILEWVACSTLGKPEWGGFGQPAASFLGTMYSLERGTPNFQRDALATRTAGYGFRLLRRRDS